MAINANMRNARRRLKTILDDEEYGPKLARMNKADEAEALRLIWEGRGKEARDFIRKADEQRRTSRRIRDRVKRFLRLESAERSQQRREGRLDNEEHLFWAMYDEAVTA